jgi:Tfp pilus assembly protein PilZ
MTSSTKDKKMKQYNVTISELIKLILSLSEEHQVALLKKGQQLLSKEKRAPRKSCKIPVKYTTFDRMYSDHIMNISKSGAFIETRRPIFVGEEILIDFKIEGLHKTLRIPGKVAQASNRGVGIEFKNVDASISKILPNILHLIEG